jgi:ribosomal protein L28
MTNACYHCGKTVLFGRSHTHHRGVAGGRWKKRAPKTRRIFRPNLQKVTILEKNKEKRVKLCAKCIKRIKKDLKEGKKPFLTLVKSVIPKKEKEKETSSKKTSSKETKK